MRQSFVQMYRHIVVIAYFDFVQVDRIVHQHDFLQFLLLQSFAIRKGSLEYCALQVGLLGLSTRCFDEIRQTVVLFGDDVGARKLNLTGYLHMLLLNIAGRGAHIDFVEGLKSETGATIDHKTVFHTETKELCHIVSRSHRSAISESSCDIDLRNAGFVGQTTGLLDECFDACARCIIVSAGITHFTFDRQGERFVGFLARRDKYHIFFLKHLVRFLVRKDCPHIELLDFQCAIGFATMDDATVGKGIFTQAACRFDELTYRRNVPVHLVFTGAHHSTTEFYQVFVSVQDRIYTDRIGITELKFATFEVAEGVNTLFSSRLAKERYITLERIARKAAGILDQRAYTFRSLHFVAHRTLHFTGNIYNTLIRTDHNHIIRGQSNIAMQASVENKVVDIDRRNQLTVAIHLNIAQSTDVIDSACRVKSVKYGRECRKGVSSGNFHLSHHVDRDRFGLADRQFHLRTTESRPQC